MNNLVSFEGLKKVVVDYGYLFQDAIIYTIALALGSVLVGLLIACLVTPLRMSQNKFFRFISLVYIEFIRATPIIVQIMIIYFGIASAFDHLIPRTTILGVIDLKRFLPAIIAIGINSGAYITEIIRGGINSIDIGQTEAAKSLGMNNFDTIKSIILPQAVRNILPALGNEFVTVIKETSIAGAALSVKELMYIAGDIQNRTYLPLEPLIVVAGIYFCLTFPTSKLMGLLERRLGRGYK